MQLAKNGDPGATDFRCLFESSPVRQAALAPVDLTVVAASQAYLSAVRMARDQVVGRRLLDLFPSREESPGDPVLQWAAALRASIDRVLHTGAPDVMEARNCAAREWIAVNSPVLDERGEIALIIHSLEDATDRLQAQRQLATAVEARDEAQRTSQLKTRFLGMVSHELRTPLTALSLQVERMQRNGAELARRHQESLERIASSAGRLREMVETLLEYARIDGGHVSVNSARFDLGESVREAVVHHRYEAELRGLELRCALAVSPALVQTDQHLVELVISNLLDNAIKFTPVGSIDVNLDRSPEGDYRVAVADTGPGIPLAQQKMIFEPFEQLGSGRKSLAGIGLGLALVRDIAAALGGRIELASKPDVGSIFTFVLPVVAANGTRKPRESRKD